MGVTYKIFSILISSITPNCLLLTLGSLGAASRLPSGLKSHPSCSRFTSEETLFPGTKCEVARKSRGKRSQLQPEDQPWGVMGLGLGPRTGWWSGHRAPLSAPCFPGPGRRAAGGGAGPAVRAGPALSWVSSRRGRPGREAGGQRRGGRPPPTGAAPGPSKSREGSLLFLAGTLSPTPTLCAPRFPPGGHSASSEALYRGLGPRLKEVRARSGLSDKPGLGAPLALRSP